MTHSNLMNQHVTFMGEFMTNVNALTAGLLKDLRSRYGISNEQSSVLLMLSNDKSLTLTEITLRQGVNKAAVSRRIKKLVDLGLVKWVNMAYEYDKRLKYVALTEAGIDYVRASRNLIADLANDMLSDIPLEKIEQTRDMLELIDERIQGQLNQL
ncbi:MarR family winged helix-turn-helix transcriptional regulator [Staphylococcus pseudintermedius]|uniref:MarR family winged helix-turn-helix transcriptional regulator n=1 Tax=Staphylococcus pseudintermedius TaxID=283734 RepID=UPI001A102D81|nr:MarR family transcriptional regulator [Staphylococcus pseudintermedius]EGQ1624196.1 MarR family transcriptional regulator [Staphylococcus pseudintermedius]EGQ1660575.1 MarR family transcriptional regulator [Staphylococcus pseudintermedius]EGQ2821786.1 MarR family transcriptional regulator [Staphylococcus pseudintermedius]EGQ3533444.1 MarR family transcriptional regulator [Staphylococcus pseudintermedius]EGQ3824644.1 MarR family transcriptional regulator [Staphylococcus pseudintermedius]